MGRLLNIIISIFLIVFLAPLFIFVLVVLKFSGDGELIYKQARIGYQQRVFHIYKFATMIKNSENLGSGTLTMLNDPRVFPFGAFLRKTKINELPQIFNILFGDMTIVGPRPILPDGEKNYSDSESKYIRSVLPGVTGIGSLILRDEESFYAHRDDARDFYKNVISPYKAKIELWYVDNKSLMLDVKIIIFTVIAIIYPKMKLNKFFKGLPKMPRELSNSKYKNNYN